MSDPPMPLKDTVKQIKKINEILNEKFLMMKKNYNLHDRFLESNQNNNT